jgi:ABC-2 type transport system ATP-binding protein
MSHTVIETAGLRKEFRTRKGRHIVAVEDLDLAVPAGGVHGFLGPNGSGKTTTIRMLLGLARATSGEMRLFGRSVPQDLPAVMDRVGAVVEQPKFVPTFSGRTNLSLLARSIGVPSAAVDAALDQVGLAGRDRERFKSYSLGMKQRLAIAATLLKSPDLLILDEPTNGLDPAGIRDIRDMIRRLGDSGVTVLLSSHILAEVQQVCESVSIIGNGRLLASGDVATLVRGTGSTTRVGVADPAAAAAVLDGAGYRVARDADLLTVDGAEDPADLTRLLADHGMYVHELTRVRADLESVFLQLTRDDTLTAGTSNGQPGPAGAAAPAAPETATGTGGRP